MHGKSAYIFAKPLFFVEGISARIHVANSQGDRAKENHRSDRRHRANSLGERFDSNMTLVAIRVIAGARISSWWVSALEEFILSYFLQFFLAFLGIFSFLSWVAQTQLNHRVKVGGVHPISSFFESRVFIASEK